MNRPLFSITLAAVSALVLSNCASTTQTRIEQNPAMYGSLSSAQKQAVNEGRLLEGMSKDAVYLAWGRPAAVKEGSKAGQKTEKWRYTGHQPVVSNHINFGYGYGHGYGRGRGRYYDPFYSDYGHTVDYVPYTAAVVEFSKGKVLGWERERR